MGESNQERGKKLARLLKNRRAQVEDNFYMIVMLLALAIGGVIATYAVNEFVTMAEGTDAFVNSSYNDSIMGSFRAAQTVNSYWDYLVLVVLLAFALAVIILGFFVDVHTIFFPLYIIGVLVGVGVSVALTEVWNRVVAATQFATLVSTDFPITDHILSNLGLYFVIVAGLSMVALYAKTRNESVI